MSPSTAARVKEVLLVEDNAGDIALTEEAFQDVDVPCKIISAADGDVAMSLLNDCVGQQGSSLPDLILLDLNLPRRNGFEVLKDLKDHNLFRRIPVLVLSSSRAAKDVERCLDLYANAYLIKPNDPRDFRDLAKNIAEFWLRPRAVLT